ARRLGTEILVTRSIARIDTATRELHLDGGDVPRAAKIHPSRRGPVGRAARLSLAGGVAWRQRAIDGFDRLAGKGISYGAARSDAAGTHGLDVHIVGAGNSAGHGAVYLSRAAPSGTLT